MTSEQIQYIETHKKKKSTREQDTKVLTPLPCFKATLMLFHSRLDCQVMEEQSIFHGDAEKDYQGRTFLDPPSDLPNDTDHQCFLPKKCVHTYTGHTKGVAAIRFFPKTGHLLLSASMDSKVKVKNIHSFAFSCKKRLRCFVLTILLFFSDLGLL